MSISFQAKGGVQLSQQLKVQELNVVLKSTQANSAAPVDLQLASLTDAAATRAIAVKCGEAIDQIISVSITNQATGAIVPLDSQPVVTSSSNISTVVDASAIGDSIVVCVKYVVAE